MLIIGIPNHFLVKFQLFIYFLNFKCLNISEQPLYSQFSVGENLLHNRFSMGGGILLYTLYLFFKRKRWVGEITLHNNCLTWCVGNMNIYKLHDYTKTRKNTGLEVSYLHNHCHNEVRLFVISRDIRKRLQ